VIGLLEVEVIESIYAHVESFVGLGVIGLFALREVGQ